MPDFPQLANLFALTVPVWELVIRGRNGRLIRRNMRAQFITEKELHTKRRENGVESLAAVKVMYLEPDGEVSVIKSDKR